MHLIIGATGSLDGHLTRSLLAAGERVRVFTRDPARARVFAAEGAEVVRGDMRDAASVRMALQDVRGRGVGIVLHPRARGQRQPDRR